MRITIFLFFIAISSISVSQTKHDELLWLGFGVKYKVTKKIRLDAELQYRNHSNFSKFQTTFPEFAVNYEFAKNWIVNGNYRLMVWKLDTTYQLRHRYALQVEYKKSFPNGFEFGFRERYQNDQKPTSNFAHNFRTLSSIGCKLNPNWKLFLWNEVFFTLNSVNKFTNYRVSFGFNKKFTDKINLMLYYNYQTPLYTGAGVRNHIIVARGFYTIGEKKKKE